jgi:hypothetical protein
MNAGSPTKETLAYIMQYGSISSLAPRSTATCGVNMNPIIESNMPNPRAVYMINEKIPFAFFSSPSPNVNATKALPPAPNINPIAEKNIINGKIKFNAEKGVLPT